MKNKIIILIGVILIIGSVFIVNNFNSSNAKAKSNSSGSNSTSSSLNSNSQQVQDTVSSPFNKNVVATPAINFKLKDLYGKEVSLKDLKGKKVFLNFWATWCPSCKAEMPEIEKIYEESKDNDLVIIAVNLGEDKDTVKTFMNQNKYKFRVLLDTDKNIAAQYQISAIPTSFFIDKKGNIISKNIGAMSYDEMKASIRALDN